MLRRAIDLVVAVLALIALGPILVVVALAIKLSSRGPVFYSRHVIGRGGRPFHLHGFRTMTNGTEFRPPADRLTPVGRVIRDVSLDHVPQLLNLLKGDISIVGPRAMEVDVVDLSEPVWQRYVSVRPGLLSYAVLKLGRHWTPSRATHPALNQELELEYLDRRSATFDARLALQGLGAFVASGGNVKARGRADDDISGRLGR